jgi:hypothetical protein
MVLVDNAHDSWAFRNRGRVLVCTQMNFRFRLTRNAFAVDFDLAFGCIQAIIADSLLVI